MNHLYDVISYNIKLALKVEQRTFTEKFWYHSKNLKILRIILEWLSVLKSLNLLLIRWWKCWADYNEEEYFNNIDDYMELYCDQSFSNGVYLIIGLFSNGPCKLEHLALKSGHVYDIPLDGLSKHLKWKATHGLYLLNGKPPECLTTNQHEPF